MSSKKTSVKKEKKKSSKSKLTGKKRNRSKKSKNLIFEVSKNSQNEKEYFIYKDNNKEIINNIKISFVSPSFSKKSKIIYNFRALISLINLRKSNFSKSLPIQWSLAVCS